MGIGHVGCRRVPLAQRETADRRRTVDEELLHTRAQEASKHPGGEAGQGDEGAHRSPRAGWRRRPCRLPTPLKPRTSRRGGHSPRHGTAPQRAP
eukprot:2177688-Pyramimonas_sp.AAC.1